MFLAAREILRTRRPRYSEAEMLSQLEALFLSKGRLSQALIRAEERMAPCGLYVRRFGSLQKAYKLVGCSPSKDVSYIETKRYLRNLQAELISKAIREIEQAGGSVEEEPLTRWLVINRELTLSLVVVECYQTKFGTPRWNVQRDLASPPDITVAVRMNPGNRIVRDYYLFPRLEFDHSELLMAEENGCYLDAYRSNTLSPLFDLVARTGVRRPHDTGYTRDSPRPSQGH